MAMVTLIAKTDTFTQYVSDIQILMDKLLMKKIYCVNVFSSDGDIAVTMEDVLAFMTGAFHIPPCGFHKKIDIHFFNQEPGVNRLPHVSTCSLEMWLPRGIGPDHFSALMLRCLKESGGFLKV